MTIPSHLIPADGRFGSGPSRIPAKNLDLDPAWMGTSHRAAPVVSCVGEIRDGIRTLFSVPDDYEIILGNGGASLLWDAIAFSVVEGTSQCAVMGAFSAKAASAMTGHPAHFDPEIRKVEPGRAIECVASDASTYLYPHNETSTGVMLPVRRIGTEGQLTLVDGTSAAGGTSLDITQTDIYYFSPQKCFASDGGLYLAILSPAAVERIERVTASRWIPDILNLSLALEASRKNQTLNTPALATLHLLREQIRWMLETGGLAAMNERTMTSSRLVYDWIEETNWAHPFAQRDYRSQTTVTFDIDLPQAKVEAMAAENGIVDIGGYRGLGRNQLRIATFPATEPADIVTLLEALTWIGDHLS